MVNILYLGNVPVEEDILVEEGMLVEEEGMLVGEEGTVPLREWG